MSSITKQSQALSTWIIQVTYQDNEKLQDKGGCKKWKRGKKSQKMKGKKREFVMSFFMINA